MLSTQYTPHPQIMGSIKECDGKMWMGEHEYTIL